MLGDTAVPNIVVNTPEWLALLTTGVGAVEGAVLSRGSKRNSASMDIVGTFVLALFLGLGGGLARDTLLGNDPVVAIRSPWYLTVVIVAAVVVIAAGRFLPATESRGFLFLDALTLGLYAAIGVQYALDFGVSIVGAVVVGLFASLSGGVIVSLLRQETPQILRPGFPYGLLALAGVLVYLALTPVSGGLASIACVAVVVGLRFITLHWNIQTPTVAPIDPKP